MKVPFTPLEFRERAVAYFGDKTGIVDGEKRFTYAQYDKRVNRLANAMTDLGIEKGEVVSFITYNSHQLLEAYYSVPQIHAILNPINIRLTQHEIEYILKHANTRILFFHQDLVLIQLVNAWYQEALSWFSKNTLTSSCIIIISAYSIRASAFGI